MSSTTHPVQAATHLKTLTQQLRATSLQQETTTQAFQAQALSQPQLEDAKVGFGAARQVVLSRMLAAIENCDLVQAEDALLDALKFSARLRGLNQAQPNAAA
jgi:hypothetical protein